MSQTSPPSSTSHSSRPTDDTPATSTLGRDGTDDVGAAAPSHPEKILPTDPLQPLTEVAPHIFMISDGYKILYRPLMPDVAIEDWDVACADIAMKARVRQLPMAIVPAMFSGVDSEVDPIAPSIRAAAPMALLKEFEGQAVVHISTNLEDRLITEILQTMSPMRPIHISRVGPNLLSFYNDWHYFRSSGTNVGPPVITQRAPLGSCSSIRVDQAAGILGLSVQLSRPVQEALKAALASPSPLATDRLFVISGHVVLPKPDINTSGFRISLPFLSPSPTVLERQRLRHGIDPNAIINLRNAVERKRAILNLPIDESDITDETRRGPWNKENIRRCEEEQARLAHITELDALLPNPSEEAPAALLAGRTLCAENTFIISNVPPLPAPQSMPSGLHREDALLPPSSSLPLALEAVRAPMSGSYQSYEDNHSICDWALVEVDHDRDLSPTYPHIEADSQFWSSPERHLQNVHWENDRSGGPHTLELSPQTAWLVLNQQVQREGLPVARCPVGFMPIGGVSPGPGDSGTPITLVDDQLLGGTVFGPKPVGVILGGPAVCFPMDAPYTFIRDIDNVTHRILNVLHLDESHRSGVCYYDSLVY
ncbi:hypothetical protein FB451DRAFT_750276 [Mycena latifolia]|nr:hypothetical protein FB451DRAFT_750276 [Mycena latifolia]